MKLIYLLLLIIIIALILSSCGLMAPKWKRVLLDEQDVKIIKTYNIQEKYLKKLHAKPLYKFSEHDLDVYLGYLYFKEPDLRERIQQLARKCVNQPYEIYLLGEFPVEIYDPQPLFSLKKSDCVVFSEHIYAMALSYDWRSFFAMLQRIRYKDGEISLFTRNHYTEYDWDRNNRWLVADITEELVAERAEKVISAYDKSAFFSKWNIGQEIPIDSLEWTYIPYKHIPEILDKLQPGDFVNVVRGNEEEKYIGHVGLITKSSDGTINFLHSTRPKVVEQPLLEYLNESVKLNEERSVKNQKILVHNEKITSEQSKKSLQRPLPYFYGFKFLRLQDDPLWELIKIDGINAPRVIVPPGN